MFKKRKSSSVEKKETRILPKLSLFFFDRPKITAAIWLSVFVFGILSYTSLLNREGFPTIEIPYTVVGGSYLVNDPEKVDKDIINIADSDPAVEPLLLDKPDED